MVVIFCQPKLSSIPEGDWYCIDCIVLVSMPNTLKCQSNDCVRSFIEDCIMSQKTLRSDQR